MKQSNLHLQNTLNMSKTTRVYFGVLQFNWKCIGLISVIESMALDELLNVIVVRKWKKLKK